MFGWIDKVWHAATGHIDSAIADWVHATIHGLYSFLSFIFGPVGDAWTQLSKDIYDWLKEHADWTITVAHALEDVYRWINKEGYEVYYYITHPSALAQILYRDVVLKAINDAEWLAEQIIKYMAALPLKEATGAIDAIMTIIDKVIGDVSKFDL
jgi:hypothetical protein